MKGESGKWSGGGVRIGGNAKWRQGREREVEHTADEALTLVVECLEEMVFGSKLWLVDVGKIWW